MNLLLFYLGTSEPPASEPSFPHLIINWLHTHTKVYLENLRTHSISSKRTTATNAIVRPTSAHSIKRRFQHQPNPGALVAIRHSGHNASQIPQPKRNQRFAVPIWPAIKNVPGIMTSHSIFRIGLKNVSCALDQCIAYHCCSKLWELKPFLSHWISYHLRMSWTAALNNIQLRWDKAGTSVMCRQRNRQYRPFFPCHEANSG